MVLRNVTLLVVKFNIKSGIYSRMKKLIQTSLMFGVRSEHMIPTI